MTAFHEPVTLKPLSPSARISPVAGRPAAFDRGGDDENFRFIRVRGFGTARASARRRRTAPENYESWPLLQAEFPSTGGGGIIIKGYDLVIANGKCVTDFSAHTPDGKAYYNVVEFEIVDVAGGKLCTNGKWRAKDGSANGTTPFRVFIKDGVRRASQ